MADTLNQSDARHTAQFVTPAYVVQRPEGLFILTEHLADANDFIAFIDNVHGNGARFSNIDYGLLLKLAFDEEALPFFRNSAHEMRLATAIAPFPEERQKLYRATKSQDNGKRVEYLFEPVTMEMTVKEPVYGEPDASGMPQVISYRDKVDDVPVKLDFDEFVAAMWLKGIKYGLDEAAIRESIASGETVRMTIAHQLEPTAGRDAEIVETCADLHRDDSPKILPDGKADLHQFKNRFPQMAKGTVMLKKIACVPGKSGRTVSGAAIQPKPPKDLDLHKLVSEGTEVEVREDGEYIVATMDGFLSLDTKTNKISVTEKIENKGGISARTTGDLMLSVDEFIEHGEVQEGRVVKGRNMSFMSDVFGHVLSDGGSIRFKKNLSGGLAQTRSGDIECTGRILRSEVQTGDGALVAKFCESSKLIARRVQVEHAVSCEIIAEEIEVGTLEGCIVAAKRIHIHKAVEHRGKECLITMLVPDLRDFDQLIAKTKNTISESSARIETNRQQREVMMSDVEFAKFCAIVTRVKRGEIKISAEQTTAWRKLVEKHSAAFNQVAKLDAETTAMQKSIQLAEEAQIKAEFDRYVACEGISCVIDHVGGQTTGQTMRAAKGMQVFAAMSANQIVETLQRMDDGKARIFSEDSGTVKWQLVEPVVDGKTG